MILEIEMNVANQVIVSDHPRYCRTLRELRIGEEGPEEAHPGVHKEDDVRE